MCLYLFKSSSAAVGTVGMGYKEVCHIEWDIFNNIKQTTAASFG